MSEKRHWGSSYLKGLLDSPGDTSANTVDQSTDVSGGRQQKREQTENVAGLSGEADSEPEEYVRRGRARSPAEEKAHAAEVSRKRSAAKKTRGRREESQVCTTIKDFPKEFIYECRREFPKADNQTDLLVAWIAVHAGGNFMSSVGDCLTEKQVALIRTWEMTPEMDLQKKATHIITQLSKIRTAIDTNTLIASYLAFDRAGFRRENPSSPGGINFMEEGVVDALLRAESQTKRMSTQRNIRKGRPQNPDNFK